METICLDLAQKNIHQIGLSEFTTTTHNQKSTPNQQKKKVLILFQVWYDDL